MKSQDIWEQKSEMLQARMCVRATKTGFHRVCTSEGHSIEDPRTIRLWSGKQLMESKGQIDDELMRSATNDKKDFEILDQIEVDRKKMKTLAVAKLDDHEKC